MHGESQAMETFNLMRKLDDFASSRNGVKEYIH